MVLWWWGRPTVVGGISPSDLIDSFLVPSLSLFCSVFLSALDLGGGELQVYLTMKHIVCLFLLRTEVYLCTPKKLQFCSF